MDADVRCLGKFQFAKNFPNPETSATKRGHKIHASLENNTDEGLSESDARTAYMMAFEEGRLVGGLEKDGIPSQESYEGAEIVREKRLWIRDSELNQLISAKVDVLHILGDRALVCDMKSGFGFTVPIEQNWQMKTQVACIASNYPVKFIRAALIHPHHPESCMEHVAYDEHQIAISIQEVTEYALRIANGKERTPNFISCNYCAAKVGCPEFTQWIESIKKPADKWPNLDPTARGTLVKASKLGSSSMSDYNDQIKELAKNSLLEDKDSVKGYRLSQSGRLLETSK